MRIGFIGSSLVSSHWNGAATYYRGLLKALAERGHAITFYEPDAYDRQAHRDIDDPPWARVVVWPADETGLAAVLDDAREVDLLVKASGVGVFDPELERLVVEAHGPGAKVAFWDVDAPATLERLAGDACDPFHKLIPQYDMIFVYGGGEMVERAYASLGAKACVPICNAVDPETHHPVPPEPRLAATLSFLGNRLPDREARVEEFFLNPASALPEAGFLLGGAGWGDRSVPANVRVLGHVATREHNAFNCSARAVLNINRASMARWGFSPPTRIFEAAGAGACMITDAWPGIATFFEPGKEILVAEDGADVVRILRGLSSEDATAIGLAARRRVLAEHTYAQRAALWDEVVRGRLGRDLAA